MLGVTLFGIFLTPVFYYVIQWFGEGKQERNHHETHEQQPKTETDLSAVATTA
jgi:hypothetical protein